VHITPELLIALFTLLLNVVNTTGEYLFGRYIVEQSQALFAGSGAEAVAARERFVDHHHERRRRGVGGGDAATREQRLADRGEIAGRDSAEFRRRLFGGRRLGTSVDDEAEVVEVAAERQHRRRARGFDARDLLERRNEPPVVVDDAFAAFHLRTRRAEVEDEGVAIVEPFVDAHQVPQTPPDQQRADEQHDRDRDLQHDQRRLRAHGRRGVCGT